MSTTPLNRRTSFTLSAANRRELQRQENELKKRGVIADRTDLIRAFVHETPEDEILARGILGNLAEWSETAEELSEEFAPVRMLADDLDKLERIVKRLGKIDIKVSRGALVRGLIMSKPPVEKLEVLVKSYWEKVPDGRAVRWQTRET